MRDNPASRSPASGCRFGQISRNSAGIVLARHVSSGKKKTSSNNALPDVFRRGEKSLFSLPVSAILGTGFSRKSSVFSSYKDYVGHLRRFAREA
jgi:hypothetical protein